MTAGYGGRVPNDDSFWEIDHGWDVFGADGDKVGDVADVQPNYITVSKGFIFKTDMYIPVAAIANVERDRVYLNVTKDEIEARGWDKMPQSNETDWDRGVERGPDFDHMVDTGYSMTPTPETTAAERDTLDMPVVEEQLDVRKREVEEGRVHLRKDVVSQEQSVNVPLREEEIHVERRPVPGNASDLPDNAFEEMDIEIPIRGEEADVSKRPVVREEVEVRKRIRTRNTPVRDTLRREEVRVEGEDGATLEGEPPRADERGANPA